MKYQNKTIKRRKDRKCEWYIRFRKNNIQKTVYGKTQDECLKNYKYLLKHIDEPKQKELTLKEWFEKYMQLYKIGIVRETTIEKSKNDFAKLKSLQNTKLTKLNQFDIQMVLNRIKTASVKDKVYVLLNALLEKARKNDLVQKNVMELVQKTKYIAKERMALSHEQEKTFIEQCNKNKFGDFFLVCLYQGIRRGECRALKVNDVNFENSTLRIDESINPHETSTETKNKQSNRIMPLFETTKEVLLRNMKGKKQNERIFDFVWANGIDQHLKVILKNANLQGFSTHSLRHTFITRCQEKGIPLFILQSWVGHQKGSVVTERIYTHLNQETNIKYIDIMNKK